MSPLRRLLGQAVLGFWIYTLLHMLAILTMVAGYKVQGAVKVLIRPVWAL